MGQWTDLSVLLDYIDPSRLDYQGWLNVGMALEHEGHTMDEWDTWSQRDPGRYHPGECAAKWRGFHGSVDPVTGGTIVQMARENGWVPEMSGGSLDWDSPISADGPAIIDTAWIEEEDIHEPEEWEPEKELIAYIETLFGTDDNVGYVTRSWSKPDDDKKYPDKGCWDRTAGQLIRKLSKCGGDIGSVLGDYDPEVGAWIRFNPLDGNGCKNDNVTEYRYALVESDTISVGRQNAIIRELELPVACLVHSGGKSLHAIVRIDAADYKEYRKRVDYLYKICQKNGLSVDTQNRNPSRLSRMPGATRNGRKQFLVATDIGRGSWEEWEEWIDSIDDDMPNPENLQDAWDDMPDLAPCLIAGVLRKGHKMLISGPSKAGKSFLQIRLCIAIAEGGDWLGWKCAQGRVLYVNLELDRASCLHRFRDVYDALGLKTDSIGNIDIWNLRGKSVPMDRLAPKLIRRAAKKGYITVVIDPIYKVITGDENSADQMAKFFNQFDLICTELGCAVIYCHHHSKGAQGAKRSMDRASGSGVFARDPDAVLDLIELEIPETLSRQEEEKAACGACLGWLDRHGNGGLGQRIPEDIRYSSGSIIEYCKDHLDAASLTMLEGCAKRAKREARLKTAWRIEGTLREFPRFEPVNVWFDYPVHVMDDVGVLQDIQPGYETSQQLKTKKAPKDAWKEKEDGLRMHFGYCDEKRTGKVQLAVLCESMGKSVNTVKSYIKRLPKEFKIEDGTVKRII